MLRRNSLLIDTISFSLTWDRSVSHTVNLTSPTRSYPKLKEKAENPTLALKLCSFFLISTAGKPTGRSRFPLLEKLNNCIKKKATPAGTAKCENILGTIYGEQGNLKKAKLHFEKSLASLDENKDAELAATLEVNIGIIYNIYEEYEKALSYFSKAYDKFREMGNLRRIAELKHNIGMVYTEQKYYHSALSEFDQSIQLALDSGYQTILGLSYLAKANILLNLEEYQTSRSICR